MVCLKMWVHVGRSGHNGNRPLGGGFRHQRQRKQLRADDFSARSLVRMEEPVCLSSLAYQYVLVPAPSLGLHPYELASVGWGGVQACLAREALDDQRGHLCPA